MESGQPDRVKDEKDSGKLTAALGWKIEEEDVYRRTLLDSVV
jgi:hypothetical protein